MSCKFLKIGSSTLKTKWISAFPSVSSQTDGLEKKQSRNVRVLSRGARQAMCSSCAQFQAWKNSGCVWPMCFHGRSNPLNSAAIGGVLIHSVEVQPDDLLWKTWEILLEINRWVTARLEHMHAHLYLLPSKLAFQLQQGLNCMPPACLFTSLFLKAKSDRGCTEDRYCRTSRCRGAGEDACLCPISQKSAVSTIQTEVVSGSDPWGGVPQVFFMLHA